MIVIDSNMVAKLFLPGEFTPLAKRLLQQDPDWAAPVLWRNELRNVPALYMRRQQLPFERALAIQTVAESLFAKMNTNLTRIRCSILSKAVIAPPMTANSSRWPSISACAL